MRANVPELLFSSRDDFRAWLKENAETSEGVWLVFGKTKAVVTLSANDALVEALCFGWIDGQMQSIDNTKYLKYFAKRRAKSVWPEKNKKTVEVLRNKGIMTALGEKAVETAKKNETWDAPKSNPITDEQMNNNEETNHEYSRFSQDEMKLFSLVAYECRFTIFLAEITQLIMKHLYPRNKTRK